MKFVYNEEKNEEMRHILMMQPTIEEAKAKLEKDDTDARAWYEYGTALGNAGQLEEAVEAYSHGIAFDPFYAPNYFGRGRKNNGLGRFWPPWRTSPLPSIWIPTAGPTGTTVPPP